jgi:hypothetical protein
MSIGFNHEWQQVSHTSQPENVWPQTFVLLNSPQFKRISHGGTEAPVTTGKAARAAKKKVVAENMGPLLLALLDVGASVVGALSASVET